ncbi:Hypothetical protein A7982_07911 [Minicystis rosea]|nr:Hypothetical protein A7982_07911 [Minicystis rosea]
MQAKPVSGEEEALLRDLEAAAIAVGGRAVPRTIVLDVETGDDEVRIVGVPSGSNGSADDPLLLCAQQELGGRVIPIAGAKAGSRIPIAVPLRSGEARPRRAMEPTSEIDPAVAQDSQ